MRFRAVFGVVLPVRLFCQSPEVAAKQGGRLRVLRSGCGHQVAGEKKQNKTGMFFDFKKQPRFCFATQRTGVFSFLVCRECGEAVETADHVYLECSLYRDFRAKMAPFVTRWTQAVAALPPGWKPTRPIRDLRDVMHWVHHNTPIVNDPLLDQMAQETRQAALAFHSGILHERYVTGRSSRAPHNEPDFLVAQDTTNLLHATPGEH